MNPKSHNHEMAIAFGYLLAGAALMVMGVAALVAACITFVSGLDRRVTAVVAIIGVILFGLGWKFFKKAQADQ